MWNLWEYLWAGSWTTKGLYHLNWNANDDSWNSNNWIASNISWVWGRIWSWSASFNGINSYIYTWVKYLSWTNTWTILIWFKTTETWLWQIFWNNTNVTSTKSIQIAMEFTKLAIGVSSGTTSVASHSAWYNNWEWHQCWFTRDWTTFKTIADWEVIKEQFFSENINPSPTYPCYMWKQPYYSDRYLDWEIDEAIVESRAWSASEIKKHYTYSKGRFWIL